jgi:DoxX-like family
MAVATIVVSLIVAAVLAGSSATKLLGTRFSRDTAAHLGYSQGLNRLIGVCEAAAVVGLIAGLFWRPFAIAAAGGVVLLMIGALTFHRRAGDSLARVTPALLVLLLTAAVIVGHVWQLAK